MGPEPFIIYPEVGREDTGPDAVPLPSRDSATGPEPVIVPAEQPQPGDISTTSSSSDLMGVVKSKSNSSPEEESISSELSTPGEGKTGGDEEVSCHHLVCFIYISARKIVCVYVLTVSLWHAGST